MDMDNGRARTLGGARCGWAFCFLGIVPLALQFDTVLYTLKIYFSIYTSLNLSILLSVLWSFENMALQNWTARG